MAFLGPLEKSTISHNKSEDHLCQVQGWVRSWLAHQECEGRYVISSFPKRYYPSMVLYVPTWFQWYGFWKNIHIYTQQFIAVIKLLWLTSKQHFPSLRNTVGYVFYHTQEQTNANISLAREVLFSCIGYLWDLTQLRSLENSKSLVTLCAASRWVGKEKLGAVLGGLSALSAFPHEQIEAPWCLYLPFCTPADVLNTPKTGSVSHALAGSGTPA